MKGLTPKQEKFVQLYLETGNASEAYRRAYDAVGMKPETVNVKAHELLKNGKITARVEELQEELRKKADIKKEELVGLLVDVVRGKFIIDVRQGADGGTVKTIPKTWAIERLCKMLGYDKPEQNEVVVRRTDGRKPVEEMTDEEIQAEIERIHKSLTR